eukprot:COSAG01_NODE_28334_length_663_cov_1.854610_1_plen_85_part_10
MKDIIDYYEDGVPSDATRAESAEMKRQAKNWMEKLQKEFYDEANPLGQETTCTHTLNPLRVHFGPAGYPTFGHLCFESESRKVTY